MAGSAFLLAAHPVPRVPVAGHQLGHATFDYSDAAAAARSRPRPRRWLFLAFFVAFAVKVPLCPLHTWLPDAHTEAPTAGSVVLAAVILKMGTYGLSCVLARALPRGVARTSRPSSLVLAVIGILYGAIVALDAERPETPRRVLVGRAPGLRRARHLRAHACRARRRRSCRWSTTASSTGALFLLVGMLYDRRHTRDLDRFGGLAKVMPVSRRRSSCSRARLDRPARPERVRRRVPGHRWARSS